METPHPPLNSNNICALLGAQYIFSHKDTIFAYLYYLIL